MAKKYLLLASIFVLAIVTSCNRYNKITFSSNKLYKQKEVAENIEEYDVYVHDENKTYRLENPEMSEEKLTGTTGEIISVSDSDNPEDTLNDIHLYLSDSDGIESNSSQSLSAEDIESVEMYGKKNDDGDTVARVFIIILLVIGLLLLIGLFIILLAISSSGDGGSGTSDSGGSDSGCYIATMAYGSYDAPQVLVLRAFRDRFLQKSKGGRAFIKWYYANSPSFVAKHRSKVWLHNLLRGALNVFVAMLRPFYGK